MPSKSQPQRPNHDSMAGEVDRLLRQLRPVDRVPPMTRTPTTGSSPASMSGPRPISMPSPLGVWGRVALAVILAGALTQWPYQTCGWGLIGFLASVAFALVVGVWAAWASWRRRMGLAHVVAITLIFGGLALGASQLLPRFGYGPIARPWGCVVGP